MRTLAEVLRLDSQKIADRWLERVSEGSPPGWQPELGEHVPRVLHDLSLALEVAEGAAGTSARAPRYRSGFEPSSVLREYSLLRDCILEALEAGHELTRVSEIRTLTAVFFEVIADALAQHAEQQRALEVAAADAARRVASAEHASALAREQALRAQAQAEREAQHELFMQAPVSIAILEGPEHRFTFANPAYRALVNGRDVVGKTLFEALPDLRGQGFDGLLDRVMASGEAYFGKESPIKLEHHGEGELLYLTFTYSAKRNAEGRIDGVLVSGSDVTAQVAARKRVEALVEVVRHNERELRSIADVLPLLVSFVTNEERYALVNKAYEAWFGVTNESLVGRALKDVVGEAAYAVLSPYVRRALAGERFSFEQYDVPYRLGGTRDIKVWFVPRTGASGTIDGYVAALQDITEERRAVQEQREVSERAEAANRAKDEFLATASHELRTPLTAILGWARLLRSGQMELSAYSRGLETIERNAKAQVQLIEDILDGSRIITGKLHLEIRPLDLTALVRAALDAVRPAAEAKEIELTVVLDPAAARIVGDPERLQQVVWNLANNAVKFTPKGGSVEVRLQRSGTSIELVVSDSGQGIAAEFLPFVFDRFRQAEGSSTRRHGGLGLGLALVRHLVEAHGGTVRAESEGPGRGARFIAQLPVQAVFEELGVARPARLPEETEPADARGNLSDVTILVVDDDEDARDLVATVLRSAGAEVVTAAGALQALAIFTERAPMLLISDVGMPEVDGYELMRRVRDLAGARGAHLPAIALTAYSREQDRRLALEAGFQTHVSKPVEPTELVRVAASLVRFIGRQTSSLDRGAALDRADAFLKFEKILEGQGVQDALRFLNNRTAHRFTAMYRLDPPLLRNLFLVDSYQPDVKQGDDAQLDATYCSIVGKLERSFTTEDTRQDDRLVGHPARDTVISYCGVLLRDVDGNPFGTLCHFDLFPSDVPVSEMPLMEAAAPLLMRAMRESR